jgi:hypothetical protein
VADLLECLIQIKGLRETTRRLVRAVREGPATPGDSDRPARRSVDLDRLLADERGFADFLTATVPRGGGPLMPCGWVPVPHPAPDLVRDSETGPGPDAGHDAAAFMVLRSTNLDLLDRCSAQDLARKGDYPGRGSTAVADLVAIMLARDTEALGACRAWNSARADPLNLDP